MDLKQLHAIGAIVPRTLFKRVIEFKYPEQKPATDWADPEVPELTGQILDGQMDVFIRRGSSADAIEIANASDRERPFVAIWRSVCDEKGEPVFPTLGDAMQLATWIVIPLFQAINAVSGDRPKNSQPRTSSGASSRSASAAGRSKSGKRRSVRASATSGPSTAPSAAP
jgi:hypothetical protein